MLCDCNKTHIKAFGLACIICLSIMIFICVFLVGYDYHQAHQNWLSIGAWRHLGILQMITVIIAIVVIVLGFITFTVCSDNKVLVAVFAELNLASMLISQSISIFALVAGAIGNLGDYIGCNTSYERMMTYWRSIDHIMIEADKYFCSENCLCDIKSDVKEMFQDNPFASVMITTGYTESTDPKTINFQLCPTNPVKDAVVESFIKNENNFDESIIIKQDFDLDKFATFWEHIEDRFECAGWCTTAYQIDDYSEPFNTGQRMIYKYLFSDINKGIVKNRGCLKYILEWLPRVMLAYGSITLFASIFQLIAFLMALALILKRYEYNDDYNNEDIKTKKVNYSTRKPKSIKHTS